MHSPSLLIRATIDLHYCFVRQTNDFVGATGGTDAFSATPNARTLDQVEEPSSAEGKPTIKGTSWSLSDFDSAQVSATSDVRARRSSVTRREDQGRPASQLALSRGQIDGVMSNAAVRAKTGSFLPRPRCHRSHFETAQDLALGGTGLTFY